MPMPQEVIFRVSLIGHAQGMPSLITYANRRGDEISDRLEDFFDDDDDYGSSSESDDDAYTENGSHQDYDNDGTTVSNDETTSSDDDDDNDLQGNPLGMVIDYTVPGKVKFMMKDFILGVLDEFMGELMKGALATPAANHLFNVNPDCNKLRKE